MESSFSLCRRMLQLFMTIVHFLHSNWSKSLVSFRIGILARGLSAYDVQYLRCVCVIARVWLDQVTLWASGVQKKWENDLFLQMFCRLYFLVVTPLYTHQENFMCGRATLKVLKILINCMVVWGQRIVTSVWKTPCSLHVRNRVAIIFLQISVEKLSNSHCVIFHVGNSIIQLCRISNRKMSKEDQATTIDISYAFVRRGVHFGEGRSLKNISITWQ